MIAKRIRVGRKQTRSNRATGMMAMALVAYVTDARAESLQKLEAVAALTGYVADLTHPDRNSGDGEKVREVGWRNLIGSTITDRQTDMAAVAMQSRRADPLEHLVVSWREFEIPTPAQVEVAVALFLDELNALDLQCVWAVHHNTRFVHVHIVINRVCPKTHKLRELGEGWDIDRLHQSVARIEAAQGWQAEADGTYAVDLDGVLRRRDNGRAAPRKGRDHAGERAERRLEQQAAPEIVEFRKLIEAAPTWPELHAALAAVGARYDKKGSGAVVSKIGEPQMKASTIAAGCSRSALERQLGPFIASAAKPEVDATRVQAQRQIDVQLAIIGEARSTTMRLLEAQRDATIADAKTRLGRTAYADALAAAITAEFKKAVKAVAHYFTAETSRLRILRRNAREIADLEASSRLPILFLSDQPELCAAVVVVAGYTAQPIQGGVAYLDGDGDVAFIDCRTYLRASASATDADLVAAMRVGEARFATLTLTGSESLCARAAALARLHGIAHVYAPAARDEAFQPAPPQRESGGADAATASVDYRGWFSIPDARLQALRAALPVTHCINHRPDLKLFQLVSDDRTPAEFEQLVRSLAPFLTKTAQLSADATLAVERKATTLENNRLYEQALTARTAAAQHFCLMKAKRVAAQRAAARAAAAEQRAAAERAVAERSERQAALARLASLANRAPLVSHAAPAVQEDVRHRKRDQSNER